MTYISNKNIESVLNATTTPLNDGATYTGTSENVIGFSSIVVTVKTDQNGLLYIDFSPDGTNWDSTLSFVITASTNEVHRITVSRSYYRIRILNNSGSNQTFLRAQVLIGSHTALTSPLNGTIQADSDATIGRVFGEEFLIGGGYVSGYSIVNKFGVNADVDTATVPEDIWNGGGVYTGFPLTAPEELQVFSSSASDVGTLTIYYLATNTSTAYSTTTVTLNGTTAVNTGVTAYRVNRATYDSGDDTTFNIGTITVRHRTTTANVFCALPIGKSQTNVAAYTIPYGMTGKLVRVYSHLNSATSGSYEGDIWVREFGASPRLRFPFNGASSVRFSEKPYGGITLPAMTDFTMRIISVTANNLDITGGFDLILIKN